MLALDARRAAILVQTSNRKLGIHDVWHGFLEHGVWRENVKT